MARVLLLSVTVHELMDVILGKFYVMMEHVLFRGILILVSLVKHKTMHALAIDPTNVQMVIVPYPLQRVPFHYYYWVQHVLQQDLPCVLTVDVLLTLINVR